MEAHCIHFLAEAGGPAALASGFGIVLSTVAAMEVVAFVVHKYIMHRWGWGWHRSHHQRHTAATEKNDLYGLCFIALSVAFFVAGGRVRELCWVGVGMTLYGLLYFALHDVLVHRRIPPPWEPRSGYLKRLVQAHRLHHAVSERNGAVSFGFLYARPPAVLLRELKDTRWR